MKNIRVLNNAKKVLIRGKTNFGFYETLYVYKQVVSRI